MKKIIFILLLFAFFQSEAQVNRFPSIDSAKRYTLRYIRNSTMEAFTNFRLQNVAYGTLELIDSLAGAGVIDSIWKTSGGGVDTLKYRVSGLTVVVGTFSGGGGGSSYTFTNGLTESAGTVRLGGTVTQNTTVSIADGFDFYLRGGTATLYNQLNIGSGQSQLYSYNDVNGRYTEFFTTSTLAKMRNFNNAGSTVDIGVYGGYGNINSFSSGNNTNLNVYPNYWELQTDDTGFPTTLGMTMKGGKDSITVKTYAGAGLFSFYPTFNKSFKLTKYHTYDSASYDDLTLIPKKYLNDRLAALPSAATVLNNVGTGFDLAQQGTDNVKRLQAGFGIKLDSTTTANTVRVSVDTTTQTLSDGATVTFDANAGVSAQVTLGGNRTLAFSNFSAGVYLTLVVIQDGTGSRTLTLPAGTKVINGGAGAVTLTTAAASEDILTFFKIGTTIYCNYGKNYN